MTCAGCGWEGWELGRPSEIEIQQALEKCLQNPLGIIDGGRSFTKLWNYCIDLFFNTSYLSRSRIIGLFFCENCAPRVDINPILTQRMNCEWSYMKFIRDKYNPQILQIRQRLKEQEKIKYAPKLHTMQDDIIAEYQRRQSQQCQPTQAYLHYDQYANPSFGFPQIPF